MKFIPRFTGTVFGGEFIPKDEDSYRLYLRTLEDREVEATICEPHKNRTIPQNKFYWSFLHLIHEETGEDEEALHELFKHKFLPKREEEVLGEKLKFAKSTTTLTRKEFTEYLEKISQLVEIPLPDTEKVSIQ